ncbi:MAG TPA: hypothetical protein VJ417_05640 [Candidatus Glassbacteria bacterium]|nr:hypothetical protein [Candidatus Glassbacteria bacterium]
MDTLAHGLWGGMIAGWKKRFGLAFLFGMAPDLLSFGLWMAIRWMHGQLQQGRPNLHALPDWLHTAYNFTHSLIIIGSIWALLWWWQRELAVPFSAWIIHILCDIPTHTRRFFPTPFLFPLSDFTVNGFSWGQRWFMILNYSCLLVMATAWIISRHRRRKSSKLIIKRQASAEGLAEEPAGGVSSSSSRSA